MYLYLGQNTVVCTKDIIGIFDLENTTTSKITRDYLATAQKKGRVVVVSPDLPKSFVVCEGDGCISVYLSQISPATLFKRTDFLKEMENMIC